MHPRFLEAGTRTDRDTSRVCVDPASATKCGNAAASTPTAFRLGHFRGVMHRAAFIPAAVMCDMSPCRSAGAPRSRTVFPVSDAKFSVCMEASSENRLSEHYLYQSQFRVRIII
jgi:hypothetical protein